MEIPSKSKSKLMTLSCGGYGHGHDRLIELPEPIIYHVFSFLGANDIARLSFASKRYQQICISSPYLHFDVDFAFNECNTKCTQFKEFLNKFLNSRGGNKIDQFSLHWRCESCRNQSWSFYDCPYYSWVYNALRCNVQELDIELPLSKGECFVLPIASRANTCQSVTALKLNLHRRKLELLPVQFASLESLSLNSVCVGIGSLEKWISAFCTSLKRLNLEAIHGVNSFSITNSNLEELTMHNCILDGFPNGCDISITGSSLKSVNLFSCIVKRQCHLHVISSSLENLKIQRCCFAKDSHITVRCSSLENLRMEGCIVHGLIELSINCPSLKNMAICQCSFDLELLLSGTCSSLSHLSISECSICGPSNIAVSVEQLQTLSVNLYSLGWKDSTFTFQPQNLMALQDASVKLLNLESSSSKDICNCILNCVKYAKVLQLTIQVIEVLCEKDHMPILFDNLQDFVVICGKLEACQMTAIACFLVRSPKLRTLTIRCDLSSRESKIRYDWYFSGIHENDVKNELVKLLPLAVDNHQLQLADSENLLLIDQLMKMKIEVLENDC